MSWEDCFTALPAEVQREVLASAQHSGVIFAHLLPVQPNGSKPKRHPGLAGQLLAGMQPPLDFPTLPEITYLDADLDACQRDAVATALGTPDFCLIQGHPGTGKTRVIAEIVGQAARQGLRILLLGTSAAALEAVLGRLEGDAEVYALRSLAAHESPESLPASIRSLTLAERERQIRALIADSAVRQQSAMQNLLQALSADAGCWQQLDELAEREDHLRKQLLQLLDEGKNLQRTVESDASKEAADGRSELLAGVEALRKEKDLLLERIKREHKEAEHQVLQFERTSAELGALQQQVAPFVEARRAWRIYSVKWLVALFRGWNNTFWTQLENRQRQASESAALCRKKLVELDSLHQNACLDFEIGLKNLIRAEIVRREEALNDRRAVLELEHSALRNAWDKRLAQLGKLTPLPGELSSGAVKEAQGRWAKLLEECSKGLDLANAWSNAVQCGEIVPADLLASYVNVVASTLTASDTDLLVSRQAACSAAEPFDLLIVDEARSMTEADLLRWTSLASRWVLVAESAWEMDCPSVPATSKSQPPSASHGRSYVAAGTARELDGALAYSRIWDRVHCDPRQLPYQWIQQNGRLVCRLLSLTTDQFRWLESERVADHPEIELRILAIPDAAPVLAEILFPDSLGIRWAKEYVFRELQELAVSGTNHSFQWHEDHERVVLRLASGHMAHHQTATLSEGVREHVGLTQLAATNGAGLPQAAWQTCCLEFDVRAGWRKPRAQTWISEYCRLRNPGRTIQLEHLHRMDPQLAKFLAGLLDGPNQPSIAPNPATGSSVGWAVEFVPVPGPTAHAGTASGKRTDRRRQTATQAGETPVFPRKGGAGLELDMSDARHRERLPQELRPGLPHHGFANFIEAQAVARMLACWARQPPSEGRTGASLAKVTAEHAPLVLALYEAQAELIRRLLRPMLARGLDWLLDRIQVPEAWRQKEADTVVLSMTRSHHHRAVTFGPSPEALRLAVTRARKRLTIFGDPGTIIRRCQWQGPLDHFHEISAARERQFLSYLVQYLDGQGTFPSVFRIRQGDGA